MLVVAGGCVECSCVVREFVRNACGNFGGMLAVKRFAGKALQCAFRCSFYAHFMLILCFFAHFMLAGKLPECLRENAGNARCQTGEVRFACFVRACQTTFLRLSCFVSACLIACGIFGGMLLLCVRELRWNALALFAVDLVECSDHISDELWPPLAESLILPEQHVQELESECRDDLQQTKWCELATGEETKESQQ